MRIEELYDDGGTKYVDVIHMTEGQWNLIQNLLMKDARDINRFIKTLTPQEAVPVNASADILVSIHKSKEFRNESM